MSAHLELIYRGQPTAFRMEPVDRKRLLGGTRIIALDVEGRECPAGHLTRDGKYLLLPGSTADTYVDAEGNSVERSTLSRGDGAPAPARHAEEPVELEGPVPAHELLDGVATRVHRLDAEALHSALDAALRAGAVFRLKRPRTTDTTYLLANDAGVFLVSTEPCGFPFVGPNQAVTDTELAEDDDDSADPFAFDDATEVQR